MSATEFEAVWKRIKNGLFGSVGVLALVGVGNAWNTWSNTQSFMQSQAEVNKSQVQINQQNAVQIEQNNIKIAELKEQTSGFNDRLRLMESRTK